MNQPAFRIFLVFLTCLYFSCTTPELIGEWKTTHVKFIDTQGSEISMDLSNPQAIKDNLLNASLEERQIKRNSPAAAIIKADVERKVSSYLETGLKFLNNDQFEMVSNGLIIFNSMPGWHFGNVIKGNWTLNKNKLSLVNGISVKDYQWTFEVLEMTSSRLRIKLIQQGGFSEKENMLGPGNEFVFTRK